MAIFNFSKMTAPSLFKKPETNLYPVVLKEKPDALRGHVEVKPPLCVLCKICEKRCPTGAITVDKENSTWSVNRFRCVICGNCVTECPKDAIGMYQTYEPVNSSKHTFTSDIPFGKKDKEVNASDAS